MFFGKSFCVVILFSFCLLFGAKIEPSTNELTIYSQLKFKIDYEKQDSKVQKMIQKQYIRDMKIGESALANVKNDDTLQIMMRLIATHIWERNFIQNEDISERELQTWYAKHEPLTSSKYKIRLIYVLSSEIADQVIKEFESASSQYAKADIFRNLATKYSEIFLSEEDPSLAGWIDSRRFGVDLREVVNADLIGRIAKLKSNKQDFWQIIFVEDYIPEEEASFEDARQFVLEEMKKERFQNKLDVLGR